MAAHANLGLTLGAEIKGDAGAGQLQRKLSLRHKHRDIQQFVTRETVGNALLTAGIVDKTSIIPRSASPYHMRWSVEQRLSLGLKPLLVSAVSVRGNDLSGTRRMMATSHYQKLAFRSWSSRCLNIVLHKSELAATRPCLTSLHLPSQLHKFLNSSAVPLWPDRGTPEPPSPQEAGSQQTLPEMLISCSVNEEVHILMLKSQTQSRKATGVAVWR